MKTDLITSKIALDKGIQKLQVALDRFNIFNATGMQSQEIKHTQFLSYILDPNEPHGLGEKFLLSFLSSIPSGEKNKLVIMDCNLKLSKITKELSIKGNDERAQIDLIIEIPSLSKKENYLVIVENKLKARQGSNQLKKYEKSINEKFHNHIKTYVFLNMQNEEPESELWIPIQYSESVYPAIEDILKYYKEVISDYMYFILSDYISLINEDDEDTVNKAANEVQAETIKFIKDLDPNSNDIRLRHLYCTYGKSIEFIKKYDSDPRKELLSHFKLLFKSGWEEKLNDSNIKLTLESSNNRYLRFSALSDEASSYLKKICHGSKTWLESLNHLAYEIVVSIDNDEIKLRVCHILGPVNENIISRKDLFNKIRNARNESLKPIEPTRFWTVIEKNSLKNLSKKIPPINGAPNISKAKEAITSIVDSVIKTDMDNMTRISEALASIELSESFNLQHDQKVI